MWGVAGGTPPWIAHACLWAICPLPLLPPFEASQLQQGRGSHASSNALTQPKLGRGRGLLAEISMALAWGRRRKWHDPEGLQTWLDHTLPRISQSNVLQATSAEDGLLLETDKVVWL